MNQNILQEIDIIKNSIDKTSELNKSFISHIISNPTTGEIPFTITYDKDIVVEFEEYIATSSQKVIIDKGNTYIEFDFKTKFNDKDVSVCQCYLSSVGKIYTDLTMDKNNTICDYNDESVLKSIGCYVSMSMINSFLFQPAKPYSSV